MLAISLFAVFLGGFVGRKRHVQKTMHSMATGKPAKKGLDCEASSYSICYDYQGTSRVPTDFG